MNTYTWIEINPFIRQFHHLFPNSSTDRSIVHQCTGLEKLCILERHYDGDELAHLITRVSSLRTLSFKCDYELSLTALRLLTQLRTLRLHTVGNYDTKLAHMTWLNSIKISAYGCQGLRDYAVRYRTYDLVKMTNLTSLVIKHQQWPMAPSHTHAMQCATNLRKLVICTDASSFPNGRCDQLRALTRLETLGMTNVSLKMWRSVFRRLPLLTQLDLRGTRGDTFHGDAIDSAYIDLYPVETLTRLVNLTSIKFNEFTFDARWRNALREWVEEEEPVPSRPRLLEYTATGSLL